MLMSNITFGLFVFTILFLELCSKDIIIISVFVENRQEVE